MEQGIPDCNESYDLSLIKCDQCHQLMDVGRKNFSKPQNYKKFIYIDDISLKPYSYMLTKSLPWNTGIDVRNTVSVDDVLPCVTNAFFARNNDQTDTVTVGSGSI